MRCVVGWCQALAAELLKDYDLDTLIRKDLESNFGVKVDAEAMEVCRSPVPLPHSLLPPPPLDQVDAEAMEVCRGAVVRACACRPQVPLRLALPVGML